MTMGYGLRRTAFDRSSYAYISGQLGVASVYDYGAVGDGVHDDTQAIQRALDDAMVLVFPSDTYLITGTLRPRSYQHLLMFGKFLVGANVTLWNFDGVLHTQVLGSLHITDPQGITDGTVPAVTFTGGCRWLLIDKIFTWNVGWSVLMTDINESHFTAIHGQLCRGDGLYWGGDPCNVHDNVFASIFFAGTTDDIGTVGSGLHCNPGSQGNIGGNRIDRITVLSLANGFNVDGGGWKELWIGTAIWDTCNVGWRESGGMSDILIDQCWTNAGGYGGYWAPNSGQVADNIAVNQWHTNHNAQDGLRIEWTVVMSIGSFTAAANGRYGLHGVANTAVGKILIGQANISGNTAGDVRWDSGTDGYNPGLSIGAVVTTHTDYWQDITGSNARNSAVQVGMFNAQVPLPTTGPTAGTIYWFQSMNTYPVKTWTATFDGYKNNSTTNQTLSFPLPYAFAPTATVNSTGLTISADTTSVTITAPDNTTAYNGVVQFVGI